MTVLARSHDAIVEFRTAELATGVQKKFYADRRGGEFDPASVEAKMRVSVLKCPGCKIKGWFHTPGCSLCGELFESLDDEKFLQRFNVINPFIQLKTVLHFR